MNLTSSARLALSLLCLTACGGPALEAQDREDTASLRSQATNPKVIYFGRLEVRDGRLKSADGSVPRAGEAVNLRLFLPELSSFLCGAYCMALQPHLFVRQDGGAFAEVRDIPEGQYAMRGPMADWPQPTVDVPIQLGASADRIEVYMHFGRISWNGYSCYLAYDMMECPDSFPIDGAYLSNYGRNFRIDVAR